MQKNNVENELQALRNALESLNLKGYNINRNHLTKKGSYFLTDDEDIVLTGCWDYIRLNHFIMGYGKAFNKFKKEENETAFGFNVEDVLTQAEQDGVEVNENEAKQILSRMLSKGDLSVGISWHTLSYFIEEFDENRSNKHQKL